MTSKSGAGERPSVHVFSLGGTIASTTGADVRTGVSPTLGATDLLAGLPGPCGDEVDVTATSVRQTASSDLTWDDLVTLARLVDQAFADGASGVVITQGTSTIEETAFALELLVASSRPVVVTGAMRNPTLAGADGRANLAAALRVAACPSACDIGALVVFNDEVHAARFVRKSHTSSPSAFASAMVGPIGYLTEGRVGILVRPPRAGPLAHRLDKPVPAVALVTMAFGDDGRLLDALPARGYAGVVIEGFGAGHVPARTVATVQRLVEQVPVVLASRTGAGEVLERTYSFAGGEIDLLGRGLLRAGPLDGPKSRILLSLCLAVHDDRARAQERFAAVVEQLRRQSA